MEVVPAGPGDQPWLEGLARDPSTAPALSIQTDVGAAIVRGDMYVLWEAGTRVGGVRIDNWHVPSRIGKVHTLMLTPGLRGRGLGVAAVFATIVLAFGELRLHRLEAEVFAYNEVAVKTFKRAGFAEEGRKRSAYWRHDAWQDSVLLATVNER